MIKVIQALRVAPAFLLALSAMSGVGCNRDGGEQTAREKHTAAQTKNRDDRPIPQDFEVDMVAAPTSSKSGLIGLKFALLQKPEVGKPVDIHVAFVPTVAGLERFTATFMGSDGLELRGGAQTPTYEKPAPTGSINHTLTVVPSADGIFFVTATVVTDAEHLSVTRTFNIPLIAGEGLSAPSSKQPPTRAASSIPAANSRQSP